MPIDRRQFVHTLAGAAIAPMLGDGLTLAPREADVPTDLPARRAAADEVRCVRRPPIATRNRHYPSNRAPLHPEYFVKLPVGSVRPGGWLRRQLELQRDGLTGHLGEISIWLSKDGNAWLDPAGQGKHGWEELPYWLKGYANIGYVLNDPAMLREARFWIDAVLANQRPSGDFGPDVYKGQGKRTPSRDLWTNMPMLFCLQSWHEHSGDPRVLRLMQRYFAWQRTIPDEQFLKDYWENSRGGDNLSSVYWLYNRTGDASLLELAAKIHRNTANWRQKGALPNWHNVNIAQSFREPATWWLQSHDTTDLNATYADFDLVRELYGQVPGGMFGADEDARAGYDDPRQAIETCGMVEQMTSNAMLLRFTGDSHWADHAEDVAFNMFPAAFTPDYRALRYLTAPNMVVSDGRDHHPGIANDGPFLMMNPFSSRCCQHNHSAGWVYYSEHGWTATPDDGLAAQLYFDGEVRARVGEGSDVRIVSRTRYPFEEQVRLTVEAPRAVDFPLYLRIPRWCRAAALHVNGRRVDVDARPGEYLRIARRWHPGDHVVLDLPMTLGVREWRKNKNSVSVDRGPLTFSLAIDERYVRRDSKETAQHDARWQPEADARKWPAFEIQPASAWNYGLLLDDADPASSFEVVRKDWPADDDPFTHTGAPIELRARGRRVAEWGIDQYGLCGVLPQSPVATSEPVTPLRLVPMGAARLRISAFPVAVGKGGDG
jgi:hypothetical protein